MIKVIENFVPDFETERAYALDLPYQDVTAQGLTYKNIALPNPPNYDLWNSIQKHHSKLIIPKVDFYRINIGSEPVSTWNIHSDISFAEMIAIHYLNLPKQCVGGTSIWRHKLSGLLQPDSPITPHQEALFNGDRNDPDKWQLQQMLEMKTNRLVIFNSKFFHSREPRDLKFFGDDPETARLVHVFFYDLVKR